MIGPLGRLGAAATLGQHCPQMTQRRCTTKGKEDERVWDCEGGARGDRVRFVQ